MSPRELRPSHRTVVMLALGLLAGVVFVLVTELRLSAPDATANRLADHALPAKDALTETRRATIEAQATFLAALETSDPAALGAAIDTTRTAAAVRDQAWAKYLQLADAGPSEVALQQAFESADQLAQQLATGLLATSRLDSAYATDLNAEREASARGLAAVQHIEERFYGSNLRTDAADVASAIGATRSGAYITFGVLAVLFSAIGLALLRSARHDERVMAQETGLLAAAAHRADFETSLQRGLEMQSTEQAAVGVIRQALVTVAPEVAAELLLADSSAAEFHQVISTRPDANAACGVENPSECPATIAGQRRFFENSDRIDTCPYLRDRADTVWAFCVPVSLAGEATAVIHAQGDISAAPPDGLAEELELVGRKAGERISTLRVLDRSQSQAEADARDRRSKRRTLSADQSLAAVVSTIDRPN